MSALIRLVLFGTVAVVALFIAIALVKVLVAVATLGLIAVAGVFLYHFARALYRRMTAPCEPAMLGPGPTTTTF